MILLWLGSIAANADHEEVHWHEGERDLLQSHSCIHDEILEQRRRPGWRDYTVTPQLYDIKYEALEGNRHGRTLLSESMREDSGLERRQPIRIFLNYDAVGHSPERDCKAVGEVVKVNQTSMKCMYLAFRM